MGPNIANNKLYYSRKFSLNLKNNFKFIKENVVVK